MRERERERESSAQVKLLPLMTRFAVMLTWVYGGEADSLRVNSTRCHERDVTETCLKFSSQVCIGNVKD